MINNILKVTFLIAVLFVSFSFANEANATVGGPSFVHSFKYNPADESVYFVREDHGGRGCPPELLKISLATGATAEVFSCDQGEDLLRKSNTYERHIVVAEINKITEDFKYLSQLNLSANNIEADIKFSRSENLTPEFTDTIQKYFNIDVYQNKNKLNSFEVSGCSEDQPFTFAGYSIPGFEKKIVLLLSTKNDCFEGGYIKEDLQIINGVSNLNRTSWTNYFKGDSALAPNEGTLVIFESENIEIDNLEDDQNENDTNDTDEYKENNFFRNVSLTDILVALILLLVGVVIGMWSSKKENDLN